MGEPRRRGRAYIPTVPVVPATLRRLLALIATLVAVSGLGAGGCGAGAGPGYGASSDGASSSVGSSSSHTTQPRPVVSPADAGRLAPDHPVSDLRTMTVAMLPEEGIDTLRLIESDGPFPYSKDGVTFSNREGLLPKHPSGWYQEYTVITPGSPDRGARRIVAGEDGARYYTSDHYASFREVISGVST